MTYLFLLFSSYLMCFTFSQETLIEYPEVVESVGYFHFDPLMSAIADYSAISDQASHQQKSNQDSWKEIADKLYENKAKDSWLEHLNKIKSRDKHSHEKNYEKDNQKHLENEKKKHSQNWNQGKEEDYWNKYGEKEEYQKDKGHYYEKRYSWHRERGKKESRGKMGGSLKEHENGKMNQENEENREKSMSHEKKDEDEKKKDFYDSVFKKNYHDQGKMVDNFEKKGFDKEKDFHFDNYGKFQGNEKFSS